MMFKVNLKILNNLRLKLEIAMKLESTKMLSDYKDLLNLTREKEFELLFDLERNIKLSHLQTEKLKFL